MFRPSWESPTQESSSAQVGIRVSDKGSGIPPEAADRVFDRHFRLPSHVGRQGMGVGLFLTKRIVEAHHGTVALSAGDGIGGTVATLTLPCDGPQAQGAPSA